jgi:hypothetical protein
VTAAGGARLQSRHHSGDLDNPYVLHYFANRHLVLEMPMGSSQSRRRSDTAPKRMAPLPASDVIELIARRNPGTPRKAIVSFARAAAAAGSAVASLSEDQRAWLVAHRGDLPRLLAEAAAEKRDSPPVRITLEPKRDVTATGAGLGERISREEGRRRLSEYATRMGLEDWAGEVAGPTALEREYGIRRSTLHDWQRRGAVIGLLQGTRKHLFPLAQFVDRRPVEGIAEISRIIRHPRTAWLWLIQPHARQKGHSPLDLLKAGWVAEVVELAKRDFAAR